jgi:hypothetical protein
MTNRKRQQAPSAATPDLFGELAVLIASIKPYALCDSCIALDVHVSHAEARDAAVSAATGEAFERTLRACHRCGRTVEATAAR